jgi:hemolysin activation/secretion protein
MRWYVQGGTYSLSLIVSTLLLSSGLPSYAQVSNSSLSAKQSEQQLESQPEVLEYSEIDNSLVFLELPENVIAQGSNSTDNTNEKRFIQPQINPELLIPEQPEIIESESEQEQQTDINNTDQLPSEQQLFQVKEIEVTGNTVIKEEEFKSLIEKAKGDEVSLAELNKLADRITQIYLDKGYITSRAFVPAQTVDDGKVIIEIREGTVEQIQIEGIKNNNIDSQELAENEQCKDLRASVCNYVRSRIARGITTPLSTTALEDQLRLLNTDPSFSQVEAAIRKGNKPGQNIIVVRVAEANPLQARFSVDNYSPPSIGSERFGINASYQNLTGLGDQFNASYFFTAQGGSNIYDFSYRIPLNAMDGTLQLRTSINNNEVVQDPFQEFDISGESQLYEISFRQPLVRSFREEFALSLGFTVQNGQTFTFAGPTAFGFGPDNEGNSRTRVIKFGQDYLTRDITGVWYLRSLFSLGIDIFDATKNSDPIPDGQFFSWLGQIQRLQRFSENYLLIAQAEIQLTPNSLLPSQQFVMGGGRSVRGYRQNARAGDNGIKFSLENQFTIHKDEDGKPLIKVAPFFDLGYVWNKDDNPNQLQEQTFLAGAGIGILWELIPDLNMRLDYGLPLVDLNDRGVNAQDNGFYFSLGYKL